MDNIVKKSYVNNCIYNDFRHITFEKMCNCITIGNENTSIKLYTDKIILTHNDESYEINDSLNIPLMLYSLISEISGLDPVLYEKSLKQKIFKDIIKDIGVKNERVLKIEKVFNEKNK